MKRILIPTDFSPAAQYGLDYALWLSQYYPTSLITLNVIPALSTELEKEEVNRKQLKRFSTSYPDLANEALLERGAIKTLIKKGKIVDEIVKTSVEEKVDLIIIGTKAKHPIWEQLFGSVSTKLVDRTRVPILVIPEGTDFKPIQHIAALEGVSE